MNGRPSVVHQSFLSLGLLLLLSGAQLASAASIDSSVKASADGPTIRAAIGPFIQQQVANLQKDDAAAQSAARDSLSNESTGGPQKTATSTYLDTYAAELNAALVPVMKSPNWRVRLNAAITAARVAQTAQTMRLSEVARLALQDKDEPVVLAGLTIARYTIPAVLGNAAAAANDKLVADVTKFVVDHPSAIITLYGYNALMLDVIEGARARQWTPAQWNAALSKVIPAVHEVLQKRLDQYQNGLPEDPQQDRRAALFLTNSFTWDAQTPALRQVTLQKLVDLMSFASQRAVSAKDPHTRDELIDLTSYVAKALKAGGEQLGAATQALQTLPRGVGGEQVAAAVQAAVQKIRAIPEYTAVKVPPVVRAVTVELKSTTGPSTEQSILPASSTQPSSEGGPNGASPAPSPRPANPAAPPANAPKTGAPAGGATGATGTPGSATSGAAHTPAAGGTPGGATHAPAAGGAPTPTPAKRP